MGNIIKIMNWLACGDVDGPEHKIREESREEFRRKFPYTSIKGILGGNAYIEEMNSSTLPASTSEHGVSQGLPSDVAALHRQIQAALVKIRLGGGCDWTWSLVNKETGREENVKIKLDFPNMGFPDIDTEQFPANRIRPIRELVNRYIPLWYGDVVDETREKPTGVDFARAIVKTLYGKTFTFNVTGIGQSMSQRISYIFPEYAYDVLLVWNPQLEYEIMRRMVEFRKELDAVKASFAGMRDAEESLLMNGATLAGRILVQGGDCSRVELDGVNVHTVKLRNGDKLTCTSESIAEAARKIDKFTIESIDSKNLVVVVSSPKIGELLEIARKEDEELRHMAAMPRPETDILEGKQVLKHPNRHRNPPPSKTDILEGKQVIIDGNNVVLYSKELGWLVLKTLVSWLERNSVDYYVYFDATIDYKVKDAKGLAFINKLKAEGKAEKCPARDEADNYILWNAHNTGSHVISNDQYRQWDKQYPWIDTKNHSGDERRVHKFFVKEGNILSVPDLGIWERIAGKQG